MLKQTEKKSIEALNRPFAHIHLGKLTKIDVNRRPQ